MKVKNQYLKILEYLHLSFNKWPSIQYKLWVSLVLWNHNNGEHCWLGCVQKTIIDTLHKEGKSQRVITERGGCSRVLYQSMLNAKLTGRKKLGGKCAQATGMTASLRILPSKIQTLGKASQGVNWSCSHASRVTTLRHLQEKSYQATSETKEASYLG